MTPLPPQPPARPSAGAAASHGASNTTPAATANVRATTVPLLVPQGLPSAYNRAPLPLPSTSVRVGGCAATAAAVNSAAAAVALPPPPQPLRFPPPSAALEAHVHASLPSPQGGGSSCTVAGASTVAVAPWLPLPAHPSPNDMWTPEVFRNRRLRSGKWIREEEIYAEALIDLFEKGLASDCTSGCTLRAYLSKKLHCAPMRISKKYAGKGIGKLAFVPQATVAGAEPSGSEAATATTSSNDKDDAVKRQEAQVQKKAEAFYLAVFQCNEYLGVSKIFGTGKAWRGWLHDWEGVQRPKLEFPHALPLFASLSLSSGTAGVLVRPRRGGGGTSSRGRPLHIRRDGTGASGRAAAAVVRGDGSGTRSDTCAGDVRA